MDPIEEMVDLVLRVFSFLVFSLCLFGCMSTDIDNAYERRVIYIKSTPNNLERQKSELSYKTVENDSVLEDGSISTMTVDGTDLWIGKLGGALLRYNIHTNEVKRFLEDKYSIIDYSIKKILTTDSSVIILQSSSVSFINKRTQILDTVLFDNGVNRASDMVIVDNNLYISTLGYGIFKCNLSSRKLYQILNEIEFVSSLEYNDNKLYIGSMRDGLYIYEVRKKSFLSRINIPLQLFNKNITNMELNNSVLYVGTAKNGLIKWDLDNSSVERVYPNQSVSSIFIGKERSAISFMGFGVYIEEEDKSVLESIKTMLITNNITSVALLEDNIITGNLKKGIIKQEIKQLND